MSALSLSFGSALAAQNPLANKAANEPAPVVKADKPIKDSQGRIRYIVDLVDEDAAELARAPKPDSIRSVRDAIDYRKNASKARIDDVAKVKGVELHSATHLVGSSFTAYLTEKQVDQFAKDKRIKLLTQDRLISPSALWNDDYNPWGQERSWGNYAMGAQHVWGSNGTANVYVLDSGVEWHPDLNVVEWLAVPGANASGCYPHATHVAGIIGAHNNGFGTVGVLPGAKIVSIAMGDYPQSGCYNTQLSVSTVAAGLDIAYARVWAAGKVAVANISNNGSEVFRWWGAIGSKMRALATPVTTPWSLEYVYKGALVVQSAGNRYLDACAFAYDGTSPWDGIVVVGGQADTGQPVTALGGLTHYPWGDIIDNASNYGPCVEVYAPAHRIKSTWGGGSYQPLSGTSMAAPHIAGLAAWLLETYQPSNSIDLEYYVRNHFAFVTGPGVYMGRITAQGVAAQPTTVFALGIGQQATTTWQGPLSFAAQSERFGLVALSQAGNACSYTVQGPNGLMGPISVSSVATIPARLPVGQYVWILTCTTPYGTSSSAIASATIVP